jgi:cytochrome c-type biogenesis protein CcmH/NrfG
MTETLAQLYLQQGAFDKAVQAYEILRLKYPEKSAIFAAQILEIRLTQRNKKP